MVEKRDTGRNLEKYYATVADTFDVAPEADSLSAPHKIALACARSDIAAALTRLPDEALDPVKVNVVAARLAPDKLADFVEELTRLVGRFEAADEATGAAYHLTLALYPGDHSIKRGQRIVLSQEKEE